MRAAVGALPAGADAPTVAGRLTGLQRGHGAQVHHGARQPGAPVLWAPEQCEACTRGASGVQHSRPQRLLPASRKQAKQPLPCRSGRWSTQTWSSTWSSRPWMAATSLSRARCVLVGSVHASPADRQPGVFQLPAAWRLGPLPRRSQACAAVLEWRHGCLQMPCMPSALAARLGSPADRRRADRPRAGTGGEGAGDGLRGPQVVPHGPVREAAGAQLLHVRAELPARGPPHTRGPQPEQHVHGRPVQGVRPGPPDGRLHRVRLLHLGRCVGVPASHLQGQAPRSARMLAGCERRA